MRCSIWAQVLPDAVLCRRDGFLKNNAPLPESSPYGVHPEYKCLAKVQVKKRDRIEIQSFADTKFLNAD